MTLMIEQGMARVTMWYHEKTKESKRNPSAIAQEPLERAPSQKKQKKEKKKKKKPKSAGRPNQAT